MYILKLKHINFLMDPISEWHDSCCSNPNVKTLSLYQLIKYNIVKSVLNLSIYEYIADR